MNEITTAELKKLIETKEDIVLLDCRGVDYYNWEHLPDAVNLRWKYVDKLAPGRFPDKKTRIITYCDGFTCHVSIRCYKNLHSLGYRNLVEYSGGLADSKAHGLPIIQVYRYKIASNVYQFPGQTFYGEHVGAIS